MAIQIKRNKAGQAIKFQAQVRSPGEKSESKTFDSFEAAEEFERNLMGAVRQARSAPEARRICNRQMKPVGVAALAAMAVSQVVDDFLKALPEHAYAPYGKRIKEFVGDARVCDLDADWTKRFCDDMRKRKAYRKQTCLAESTIAHYIAMISRMCNWKAESLGVEKPRLGLTKKFLTPGWDDGRERRLQGDEQTRIREELGLVGAKKLRRKGAAPGARGKPLNCARHYQLIFDFAIETCAREAEMVELPWREVNLQAGLWVLPASRSKTKKRRKIYLTPKAVEVLRELWRDKKPGDDAVFNRLPSVSGFGRSFANAIKRLGIEDLVFHDLRHEGISRHRVAKTFEPEVLMTMVGHSSPQMTMVYFNPLDGEVFAQMEASLLRGHLSASPPGDAVAAAEARLAGKLEGLLSLLAANALDLGADPALSQARLGERVRELLAPTAKEPMRL